MSKEKAGEKDPTLIEYETLIEKLMKENETLKNNIIDLEEQIKLHRDIADSIEEVPESRDVKKPAKLFKKSKKKEEIQPPTEKVKPSKAPVEKREEVIVDSQIFKELPKRATPTILESTSRRECPVCGNTRKGSIQEIVDKTHIILDYPRMYGKKLKCGACGQEWRVVSVG